MKTSNYTLAELLGLPTESDSSNKRSLSKTCGVTLRKIFENDILMMAPFI